MSKPEMPNSLDKASKNFRRHYKSQVRDQTRKEENIKHRSLLCMDRNLRYQL